jgi:hypothetical protein
MPEIKQKTTTKEQPLHGKNAHEHALNSPKQNKQNRQEHKTNSSASNAKAIRVN